MVVALGEVVTEDGPVAPAINAGLLPGDVITQVGAETIRSSAEFQAAIAASKGQPVTVQVTRAGGQRLQLNLSPVKGKAGEYELGLWLRDGMVGIGTVTFYDPKTGIFGALGHAVSEMQTGTLMPLGEGAIMPAKVKSARRGEPSAPGELQGEFDFQTKIGTLYANTPTGIFGRVPEGGTLNQGAPLPVGNARDIRLGAAKVLANVSGTEIREFDIEITRIFSGGVDRNMMITVTDPALIAITGGIVQGMSGSPIIQEGKVVGAVTHVLVNNPQRGYGISIDSMLANAYANAGALAA
jgi:stage IV sporulation protein B